MYMIIGIVSVAMTAPFLGYFALVTRHKVTFYFFKYFSVALWQPLWGTLVLVIPQTFYFLLLGLLIKHKFALIDLRPYFCTADDSECLNSTIWDGFYIGNFTESYTAPTGDSPTTTDKRTAVQACRVGVCLIQAGLFFLLNATDLMIPEKERLREQKENPTFTSHDKGVWYRLLWRQCNFFVMCSGFMMFELFIVHYSFTDFFANDIWVQIVAIKVMGISVENFIELRIHDKVMLSPISSCIGLVENLVTFGAADFTEFLVSHLVGLGLLFFERVQLVIIVDAIVGWIVEGTGYLKKWLSKIFSDPDDDDHHRDDYDEEVSDEGESEESGRKVDGQDDSAGSDILLTEEDCEIDFWQPKYFTKTQQKHRVDAGEIQIEMGEREVDVQNVEERSPYNESVMFPGGEGKKVPTRELTPTHGKSQLETFRH